MGINRVYHLSFSRFHDISDFRVIEEDCWRIQGDNRYLKKRSLIHSQRSAEDETGSAFSIGHDRCLREIIE